MLRHVKGTAREGLGYSSREDIAVWGYIDASDRSDSGTKKRRFGFGFMSGGAAIT